MRLDEIKNKRVAVGLFGISYKQSYKHWMGWITNVDWRTTNYRTSLLKLLTDSGNTVDHYFSTYHNQMADELIDELKPKACKFSVFDDNQEKDTRVFDRHSRFKETLNLFKDDYDYYVMTRFDLSFDYNELTGCKVANSSINITSKHGSGSNNELICDFFYIFDNSMLGTFREFIGRLPPDNGDIGYYHKLHTYENGPKFSFMIDGMYYSHNCPVWSIIRN